MVSPKISSKLLSGEGSLQRIADEWWWWCLQGISDEQGRVLSKEYPMSRDRGILPKGYLMRGVGAKRKEKKFYVQLKQVFLSPL